MPAEFKTGTTGDEDELFIHLDLDGLAALLRAVEAALATGRGHLTSDSAGGKGIAVRSVGSGESRAYDQVTLTFTRPRTPSLQ